MKKHINQMEPWFDDAEIKAVNDYMRSDGWLTEYKKTEKLEEMIANYTGAKYCVMTVNGTVTLILSLLALGLKAGDEILVPDITMIATPNSAKLLGIDPVFVDIDQENMCMDLNKASNALTNKTKAMFYVPLNGRCGDMDKVEKFCQDHKILLIEDAAQALGCYWKKKHLGTFGEIGSFSFSIPKVITTGQGGAMLTNSKKIYKKLKSLKDFGRARGGIDIHDEWGWNFKFTDIQATIGIEQMKKLKFRIMRKKEIYQQYVEGLREIRKIKFLHTDISETSPWAVDIYINNPDRLASFLEKKGIGTRRVYPAIHTQKIYKNNSRGSFPVSAKYAKTGLWLPSSTKLTNQEVNYIIKSISGYYS